MALQLISCKAIGLTSTPWPLPPLSSAELLGATWTWEPNAVTTSRPKPAYLRPAHSSRPNFEPLSDLRFGQRPVPSDVGLILQRGGKAPTAGAPPAEVARTLLLSMDARLPHLQACMWSEACPPLLAGRDSTFRVAWVLGAR